MQQRVRGRPIEIGRTWRQRLKWTTPQFAEGVTLRAHVRVTRGAAEPLTELTTANGGLVIISDRELEIVISSAAALGMPEGYVVMDAERTDLAEPVGCGWTLTIPVRLPVTRDAP